MSCTSLNVIYADFEHSHVFINVRFIAYREDGVKVVKGCRKVCKLKTVKNLKSATCDTKT